MQICCLKQKNTHVCGSVGVCMGVCECVGVRVCAHFSLMKVLMKVLTLRQGQLEHLSTGAEPCKGQKEGLRERGQRGQSCRLRPLFAVIK